MGARSGNSVARVLMRGESLVASAGLMASAIVVAALGAAAFWAQHVSRDQLLQARRDHVRSVAAMLAHSSELMLQTGSLTELRTLVAGTVASQDLHRVLVSLPDGSPIADSDLPRTGAQAATYAEMPPVEAWGSMKQTLTDTQAVVHPDGAFDVHVPMNVPSLGPALLTVRDERGISPAAGWQIQVGAAAIGVASLAGVWLAYRAARRRIRGLGAIREALAALEAGEQAVEALRVSPVLGPEAVAWNRLLDDYGQLRAKALHERAGERTGGRRARDGELGNVCDALWQGLLLVDPSLHVRYVNGAGAIFLKARREELSGLDITRFLEPNVVEAVKGVVSGATRTRVTVEVERRPTDPASRTTSILRFCIRPLRRDDSTAALVWIEDITQQRVADEARNSFVASATHELRTPLTNMRLYLDTLLEEENLDAAKRTQAINVVSTEARRLERLVGDMLSVAEIEAGHLKLHRGDVRLEPVFADLRADFEEQARQKNLTLKFELPPKWPTMTGDRDKIVLALHNLVGNAIKYTPAGGEVTVRVAEAGGHVSVDVIDTGIGINTEETDLIFEKFYRARDKRIAEITGTGLGLSLAREVARMHGGDVLVRSELDKGSTFTMTLPIAA